MLEVLGVLGALALAHCRSLCTAWQRKERRGQKLEDRLEFLVEPLLLRE